MSILATLSSSCLQPGVRRKISSFFLVSSLFLVAFIPFETTSTSRPYERHRIESAKAPLKVSLLHLPAYQNSQGESVLFLHGATFGAELSFGFRMDDYSWMDDLSTAGYDVWALDYLGYGDSDNYPEMSEAAGEHLPPGQAKEVILDVAKAVEYIRKYRGVNDVSIVGHSRGGVVASYFASAYPELVKRLVLYAPFTQRDAVTGLEEPTTAYEDIPPMQRYNNLKNLPPEGAGVLLEQDVLDTWADAYLKSDHTASQRTPASVRVPRGWELDLYQGWTGNYPYEPATVTAPTLIIKAEWDAIMTHEDAMWLYDSLTSAPIKRYVVINGGTHVVHLEKQRFQLYREVQLFLDGQDQEPIMR